MMWPSFSFIDPGRSSKGGSADMSPSCVWVSHPLPSRDWMKAGVRMDISETEGRKKSYNTLAASLGAAIEHLLSRFLCEPWSVPKLVQTSRT